MKYLFIILSVFVYCTDLFSQIVLIGDNIPHGVINDGDFSSSSAEWRRGIQSPAWKMKNVSPDVYEKDSKTMGLHRQMMFSSNAETIAESVPLVSDKYPKPLAGDTLIWSFCADQEYKGKGNISMSIVFGNREHVLTSMVSPKGADMKMEEYKGFYIIDKKDAESGIPFLRIRFCSDKGIKLFVDNIYVAVVRYELNEPLLKGIGRNGYNSLTWSDKAARHGTKFYVYRKDNPKGKYVRIAETESMSYDDADIVSGRKYDYVVTRFQNSESGPSEIVNCGAPDRIAPLPPTGLSFESGDTEIKLSWKKSTSHDVAFYSVYRVDSKIKTPVPVSKECGKTFFTDIMLPKGTECKYLIYAHDYSGNRSNPAVIEGVKTKMVKGASFSDLILPLPVTGLDSLLWGGSNVLPRCADNGIESPAWSYWGGRPVYANGKYNMVVTRWPEISVKGHWEWPFSTVAYTVSEKPEGPYKVVRETAYDLKNGLGHNPDIILLNDGTYALYSLVSWDPTIFTSSSMAGPWKRLGVLQIDSTSNIIDWPRFYQYQRNLSGVQLKMDVYLWLQSLEQ